VEFTLSESGRGIQAIDVEVIRKQK
jgi:hypothetical protein